MLLRKYIAIFNVTFKESLAYRFDAITSAVFSFAKIYLAFLLWQAIYDGKEVIGDYTFPMMMTYYILISFMSRLARSESIIWETSDEVRTGSFTKYITRPLKHFNYCVARSLSKGAFSFAVDVMAFAVWLIIFRHYFVIPSNWQSVVFSILFTILGLYTMMQVHYMIALISFKTVDIAGPYYLVSSFMGFMSGSFIPLMLLPTSIGSILAYTPFYYMLYYPAALYLGEGQDKMGLAFIVVVGWNVIMTFMRRHMYKKMLQLYEGVGA
ncbi:MAG: ABC-2 family transporter protein [Vallitaleaceae bacterium]|jgi:ABC-2 type transport system permease protein|nr:ABC-2 family transporter protein [Vallitaleaceae bacterium]